MFFSYFQRIKYTSFSEHDLHLKNDDSFVVTNILARTHIIKEILEATQIYYNYTLKEYNTPEYIASEYYSDPNKHWLVLYTNDIVDPQYDWVLHNNTFEKYIIEKYGSVETAKITIHHYEKIIAKNNLNIGLETVFKYTIDQETYDLLPASHTRTISLQDGTQINITTTRNAVYNYDYENELNESKRIIKLIDARYANDIENELKDLLSV